MFNGRSSLKEFSGTMFCPMLLFKSAGVFRIPSPASLKIVSSKLKKVATASKNNSWSHCCMGKIIPYAGFLFQFSLADQCNHPNLQLVIICWRNVHEILMISSKNHHVLRVNSPSTWPSSHTWRGRPWPPWPSPAAASAGGISCRESLMVYTILRCTEYVNI